ncbi:GNAT family N-acetyltransferase [Pedococcus sp. KACC 23699]|uniref:GNAT family N-acetyltransferase n=1 Tax=Pedococcus sp. KACC 23699 TaxID=3149228 RepID=A0AAU7JSP9_9MICO
MGGTALMRDGAPVEIRSAHLDDFDAIVRLLRGLSVRSRYQRFLSAAPQTGEYAAALFDANRTLATLVATSGGAVIAVGSLHRTDPSCAEFAMAVGDQVQGHGVGTLLLEGLVERGRALGLHRLTGEVLSTNHQMLDVLHHLGLPVGVSLDAQGAASVTSVTVDLDGDEGLRRAHRRREEIAGREFLRPLFDPAGVVVVDGEVGDDPAGATRAVTVGDVVPVRHARAHPAGGGSAAYVGAEVVVVAAGEGVDDVLRDALEAGVEAAVVTAGEPEIATEDVCAAVRAAEAAGMRVAGPAARLVLGSWCLGPPGLGERLRPRSEGVAVVGDHGRAVALVERLVRRGVDVHLALELGAAAGLGAGETAAWMSHQCGVGSLVLVVGGGTSSGDLTHLAGSLGTSGAPVVVSLVDSTVVGDSGSSSLHTVPTDRDLVELATLRARAGWRSVPKVVIVTNDPAVAHDRVDHGVPELAVLALDRDVTASAVAEVLETLSAESGVEPGVEPGVDVVVLALHQTRHLHPRQLDRVVHVFAQHHREIQLVLVDDGTGDKHGHRRRSDLPRFDDERTALTAIALCSADVRAADVAAVE